MVCLVIASLYPNSRKVALGAPARMLVTKARAPRVTVRFRHRLLHLISFGTLALLLVLIVRTPNQRIYSTLLVIALGFAIEYAQHWIFGGPIEWWDMRDDAFGAVAAYAVGRWPVLRRALVK